jgi:hypothetical protein
VAMGKAFSKLGVLPSFSPISSHDLLHAIGDGFRSKVLCFLLLGLPNVRSTLSGVVFCLDFSPFFLSSFVPLLGVFPLFIYLLFFFNTIYIMK